MRSILEWVLFIIELIIKKNMTRELMLRIIDDAMAIAEEYIQAGGSEDPVPRNLFTLTLENDSETPESILSLDTSILTESLSSAIHLRPSKQYIVIECNQEYEVFKLPTREPNVGCLSSSVDSASDNELSEEETLQPISVKESESSVDFCKVDMSTPPRLKSLQDLTATSTDSSAYELMQNQESDNIKIGDWHKLTRKCTPPVCPTKIIMERVSSPVMEEHKNQMESSLDHTPDSSNEIAPTKDQIFQAFYEHNVWNLKNEFMTKFNLGWTSLSSIRTMNSPLATKNEYNFDHYQKSEKADKERFIKSVLLLTVRQIVYDYFQHNFAFDLVKISLTTPQFLLTQDVNMDWYTPKEFKNDFKKFQNDRKRKKQKKNPKANLKKIKSNLVKEIRKTLKTNRIKNPSRTKNQKHQRRVNPPKRIRVKS
ncbi:uncharacterized protein LOC109534090 [Dendroctonus ponderosae]|uniref:uncharacterized protein LOC109534090 n=1 Tax=Dendroctonus ponderosae TaxID=77166 RepID=UPI0020350769|nr:uncharacterized protein LOC109534090 [Dendroctonus ponderosae]XP_048526166.1 uncharacterized protein LOC109534090 [Dendroctonus ponderosae]XP_048526167.1 uncharacterized protein LOC109534090 [Dendroctonus ponderosae]